MYNIEKFRNKEALFKYFDSTIFRLKLSMVMLAHKIFMKIW